MQKLYLCNYAAPFPPVSCRWAPPWKFRHFPGQSVGPLRKPGTLFLHSQAWFLSWTEEVVLWCLNHAFDQNRAASLMSLRTRHSGIVLACVVTYGQQKWHLHETAILRTHRIRQFQQLIQEESPAFTLNQTEVIACHSGFPSLPGVN
jgi:hypothetical protein